MKFKEYLIQEYEATLNEDRFEEINNMLMRLEYWFDVSKKTVEERIHHLETELINAGGAQKFAMIVRHVPSVKHFILKHRDELSGDLAHVADLL